MSTQQKRDIGTDAMSEEAVAQYLQMHPDFFERHPGLLAGLRLPHHAGPAVSLIEKQVAILRARNAKLDRKLQELVGVARSNDLIASRTHRLAVALVAAPDLEAVISGVQRTLNEEFGAEVSVLLLFEHAPAVPELPFVRRVRRSDEGLSAFASLMESAGPRCGRMTEAQREFLFGSDGTAVASAALMPLGGEPRFGILGVGSHDPDRFLPTMSVDFLSRISDLVSHAIAGPRTSPR